MRVFRRRLAIITPLGGIGVAVLMGAFVFLSVGALAASLSVGKTSQHGVVRVYLANHRVTGLIIQLRTRCTDHKRRDIWPGFQARFQHPQDANGRLRDSYSIVGRDAATGVRFRQRASFSARLTDDTLTGSAIVTQTLIKTGVICKSPRVTFSARI